MRSVSVPIEPARGARRLALLLAVLLLGGCAGAGVGAAGGGDAPAEIARELQASADRWNAGDLTGFLEPYADAATFVSGGVLLRGKAAIEARYRENYWKSGRPADTLRFAELDVRMLGADHALVNGRYLLFDAAGAQTGTGPFSLVYARTADGWRILHDHSS